MKTIYLLLLSFIAIIANTQAQNQFTNIDLNSINKMVEEIVSIMPDSLKNKEFYCNVNSRQSNKTQLAKYIEYQFYVNLNTNYNDENWIENFSNYWNNNNDKGIAAMNSTLSIDYQLIGTYVYDPASLKFKLTIKIFDASEEKIVFIVNNRTKKIINKNEIIDIELLEFADEITVNSTKDLLNKFKNRPLPLLIKNKLLNHLIFYKNSISRLIYIKNPSEAEMTQIVNYCKSVILINTYIKGKVESIKYIGEVQNYYEAKLLNL